MIELLLGVVAPLWPWILAAVAGVLAFLGYGVAKKREGAQDAKRQAKDADYENADDIRNRVERDLPGRVRKYDDAGYRD